MRKKDKTLLLVDYSNLLHRSLHAYSNFYYQGEFTGGFYGVTKILSAAIDDILPDRIVICKDKKPYVRSKQFPDYKQNRNRSDEEKKELDTRMQDTDLYLMRLFLLSNIPVWFMDGFEADDLIAYLVLQHHSRYKKIVVFSNDGDLEQLSFSVRTNKLFFRKVTKSGYMLEGRKEVIGKYGSKFSLDDFLLLHSMAGTHNDVPGIRGIGFKTALRFIHTEKRKVLYENNKELIERNKELIRIPHKELLCRLDNKPEYRVVIKKPGIKTTKQRKQISYLFNMLGIKSQKDYFLNCLSFSHTR